MNDVHFREASKFIANEIPCLWIFVFPKPPIADVHCYAHHEFQAMQFRSNIIFNVLNRWLHADLIILCIKALNIYPWLAIQPENIQLLDGCLEIFALPPAQALAALAFFSFSFFFVFLSFEF